MSHTLLDSYEGVLRCFGAMWDQGKAVLFMDSTGALWAGGYLLATFQMRTMTPHAMLNVPRPSSKPYYSFSSSSTLLDLANGDTSLPGPPSLLSASVLIFTLPLGGGVAGDMDFGSADLTLC